MKDYRVTLTVQLSTAFTRQKSSEALNAAREALYKMLQNGPFECSEHDAYLDWDNEDGSISEDSLSDGRDAELLNDNEEVQS